MSQKSEKTDALYLAELVIDYMENGNAAGEYDGNHPDLKDQHAEEIIRRLAYKVQQQEEMRIWNI